MRKRYNQENIALRAAGLLLILVILTTSIVTGHYAGYATGASVNDSFRVAKFFITESGELSSTEYITLAPGDTIQRSVAVENGSEVTIEYTVTVENPYHNLPLEFTMLDDGTEITNTVLNPGEGAELVFQIHWPENINQDRYIVMVDLLVVTVTASQVD